MSKPKKISSIAYKLFSPHLEDGEEIVGIAHRHPFVLLKGGWKVVLFGFVLPIFFWNLFPELWVVVFAWLLAVLISIN